MPFPLKTAGAILAGVTGLGITALVVFGGGETTLENVDEISVSSSSTKPLVVLDLKEAGSLEIFGPECYNDTRGNDTLISTLPTAQADCFVFTQGGNDFIDLSGKSEQFLIAISTALPARQTLKLGSGDNYIEVKGDYNMSISALTPQNSILALPEITSFDIKFRQEGQNVIIITPRGNIRILGQSVGMTGEGPINYIKLRDNKFINRSQIRVQATVGQGTSGDDKIMGTADDDILFPGLGDDTITLLGGVNKITYSGGNDIIYSENFVNPNNELFIEEYREDVSFSTTNNDRDLLITTPKGTVTLSLQLFYEVGDPQVPIQKISFKDGPLLDDEVRFLLESESDLKNQGTVDDRSRLRQ
jgi:Ca2+-binding RTX toxin-like protein